MLRTAFLLLAGAAHGAVIGIDLGSRFLKVGIIQPGTGIELVLNEATKRKSSSTARPHARCAPAPRAPTDPRARLCARPASTRKTSASMATSRTT